MMPIELQVIRASEFVRFGATGLLDLEASKEVLRSLALACRKRGLGCALLDLRAVPTPEKPWFTPPEIAALVDAFRQAGFTRQQRLAVLYRTDAHGGARLFATLSRIHGLQVNTFEEFEKAMLWLSEEKESKQERRGQPIPIQFAGAKRRSTAAVSRVAQGARKL